MLSLPDKSQNLFCDLEGSWKLERVIEGVGTMTGFVTITPQKSPGFFAYHETGEFCNAALNQGAPFYKDYVYEVLGDTLFIYFAEGTHPLRRFVKLRFNQAGETFDTHTCGQDLYKVSMKKELQKILTTIQVSGPKKDYVIRSMLIREA